MTQVDEGVEALKARLTSLHKQKEMILEESKPLRDRRDALLEQKAALERDIQVLVNQIHAIERPRLSDCMMEMGRVAKALGGPSVGKHRR